jgi:hypothetical protein
MVGTACAGASGTTRSRSVRTARDEVLTQYRAYVLGRPELLAQIGELRGQTLGWCAPAAGFQGQLLCHGQFLAALADGPPLERAGEAG